MKKATSENYVPKVYHISAPEGQPSTFWKSESGKYYRTKEEAAKDQGTAVNPADYETETSFFVKYKAYLLGALVAAVVAAALLYFIPKYAGKIRK